MLRLSESGDLDKNLFVKQPCLAGLTLAFVSRGEELPGQHRRDLGEARELAIGADLGERAAREARAADPDVVLGEAHAAERGP